MWRHFREAVFSDAASRILLRGIGRIASVRVAPQLSHGRTSTVATVGRAELDCESRTVKLEVARGGSRDRGYTQGKTELITSDVLYISLTNIGGMSVRRTTYSHCAELGLVSESTSDSRCQRFQMAFTCELLAM